MREHDPMTNEYSESWDSGTYQTGPSKPLKRQSVLITVLLMSVIFLGGIASALGVMNVHLLIRLTQQQSGQVDMAVEQTNGVTEASYDFFHSEEPVETCVPEEETLATRLGFRVQELNALCRQYWDLSFGLQVIAVTDAACQLQESDILTAINDQPLTTLSQLYSIISAAKESDVLQLDVLRAGQQLTIELTVKLPEG